MFPCSRVVDKATVDDDLPPPGIVLAEAVQLARDDPANVKKMVQNAVKKMASPSVTTRIKAIRFLTHLYQNGPPAVSQEIKLITSPISDCVRWRGAPHPRRGYEPYTELKEAAEGLLDLAFAANPAARAAAQGFSVTNTTPAPGRAVYSSGQPMESVGNSGFQQESASLAPRSLDPNYRPVAAGVRDLLGRIIGRKEEQRPGAVQTPSSPWGLPPPGSPGVAPSPEAEAPPPPTVWEPPKPTSQMGARLDGDANWVRKRPSEDMPAAPVASAVDTPTGRLLKVQGNRAIPTNSELTQYKSGLTPEQLPELQAGLQAPDWKIKLRAVCGVEVYADKFGTDALAELQPIFVRLADSPQASLKTAAKRVALLLGADVDE